MRRTLVLAMTVGLIVGVLATPGLAATGTLDGPDPAIWLSDPEGDLGDNGIEQGDPVAGSSGSARLNENGATITVNTSGLEPGHAYTIWVVYFSDSTLCENRGSGVAGCKSGCNAWKMPSIALGKQRTDSGTGSARPKAR